MSHRISIEFLTALSAFDICTFTASRAFVKRNGFATAGHKVKFIKDFCNGEGFCEEHGDSWLNFIHILNFRTNIKFLVAVKTFNNLRKMASRSRIEFDRFSTTGHELMFKKYFSEGDGFSEYHNLSWLKSFQGT